jgi:hypothetical protein
MTLTRAQWTQRRNWDNVCATAAGRRKYNEERKRWAGERQDLVFKLLLAYGLWDWGVCARIARELGCHRSTIVRDRRAILCALL